MEDAIARTAIGRPHNCLQRQDNTGGRPVLKESHYWLGVAILARDTHSMEVVAAASLCNAVKTLSDLYRNRDVRVWASCRNFIASSVARNRESADIRQNWKRYRRDDASICGPIHWLRSDPNL
jgi:hypothetical protein